MKRKRSDRRNLTILFSVACAISTALPGHPLTLLADDGKMASTGPWHARSGTWELGADRCVVDAATVAGSNPAITLRSDASTADLTISSRITGDIQTGKNGVVFGYSENGGYVVALTGKTITLASRNGTARPLVIAEIANRYVHATDNTLNVTVCGTHRFVTIDCNGNRVITRAAIPTVPAGSVGLFADGGRAEFSEFQATPLSETEIAEYAPATNYARVVDVVGSLPALFAVRDTDPCLIKFDKDGKELGSLHSIDFTADGELRPVAINWSVRDAWKEGSDLLVLADGGAAIYPVSSELKVGQRIALPPNTRGAALGVDNDGRIFIADTALPGIRVVDVTGKEIASIGRSGRFDPSRDSSDKADGIFDRPTGIVVDNSGRILVSDAGLNTYLIYAFDAVKNQLVFNGTGPTLPRPWDIDINRQNQILVFSALEFDSPHGCLRVVQPQGKPFNSFAGLAIRMLTPFAKLSVGPLGRIALTDMERGRLVHSPYRPDDPIPEMGWSGEVSIQALLNRADKTSMTMTTEQAVPTPNAQPTFIELDIPQSPIDIWPKPSPKEITAYTVPIAPQIGRNWMIDWPITLVVCTRSQTSDGKEINIARSEMETRIDRVVHRTRSFFMRHSYSVLNLLVDVIWIEDAAVPVVNNQVTATAGRAFVNEWCRQHDHLPLNESDPMLLIHAAEGWIADAPDGPGDISTQAAHRDRHFASFPLVSRGVQWLVTRETYRLLDECMEDCGVANLPGIDVEPFSQIGRYGPYWNRLKWMMQSLPRMHWFRFSGGFFRSVADLDADGLPDRDPELPNDEARFRSNARRRDTESDGLDDLKEFMAGLFSGSNPRNRDSDGDGIFDTKDRAPLLASAQTLPRSRQFRLDGMIGTDEHRKIGAIESRWVKADAYGAYNFNRLFVAVQIDQRVDRIELLVDSRDNGWNGQSDDLLISVDLDWNDSDKNPRVRSKSGCDIALGRAGTNNVIEMNIPLNEMNTGRGPNTIGVIMRLDRGNDRSVFLGEPWSILSLTLES